MPTYNGKTLVLYEGKKAGKNLGTVDGFYKDTDNNNFFIKKPADKSEFFAELFAGLILKEVMARKLIEEVYFPSLICADVIKLEDGSYALIQPLIALDELHKIIGTTKYDGSDRSVITETLAGPSYYYKLTKMGSSYGLSVALMFSLLLGAHSVHSGNIVALKKKKEKDSTQFGRIDWGDAFRNFAHKDNNTDLLYPYENRGYFNYKQFTKNYFRNYRKITEVFSEMAEQAKRLKENRSEDIFLDIVATALKKIPIDLLDKNNQTALAAYMEMPSFANINFNSGDFGTFPTEMANLLNSRLEKITVLKDLTAQDNESELRESRIERPPIKLSSDGNDDFLTLLQQWEVVLAKANKDSAFDDSKLNLKQLVETFNVYLNRLADTYEQSHISEHVTSSQNMFCPFYEGHGQVEFGHAFVNQYKESTVLRRLCLIDPKTFNLPRFAAFEKPSRAFSAAHPDSVWAKIEKLIAVTQGIINLLAVIKKAEASGLDGVFSDQVESLKKHIADFNQSGREINLLLSASKTPIPMNNESSFFYPIALHELNEMTGDQLVTICFEELNNSTPSILMTRILKEEALWSRINDALNSGEFHKRIDNVKEKIDKIQEWHQLLQISAAVPVANSLKEEQIKESTFAQAPSQKNEEVKQQLTSQIETLTQQLVEKNQLLQLEHEKNANLLLQKASLESSQMDLVTDLEGVRDKLKCLSKNRSDKIELLDTTIKHLETNVTKLEEQLHKQKLESQNVIKKIETQPTDNLFIHQDLESLKGRLQEKSKQLQQVQDDLKLQQDKNVCLEKENLFSKTQLALHPKEIETLQARVTQLEEQLLSSNNSNQEDMKRLQSVIEQQKIQSSHLQTMLDQQQQADKQYATALKNKQDIYFARMERLAPLLLHIQKMELKAIEFETRGETKAHGAVTTLVGSLKATIKNYAENATNDEDSALSNLKTTVQEHVNNARVPLKAHREEWKYILGNITVGVLLVGVGYGVAVLINKYATGNYTFFSKTQSVTQLESIERTIAPDGPLKVR